MDLFDTWTETRYWFSTKKKKKSKRLPTTFNDLEVRSQFMITLKAPRKTTSENVVCLCRLLNILADFSNLFLHTGKQCGR